jgi:Uncharacterized conserved protein (COG2071)
MRLRSRILECLCLNWAVPAADLPPPPRSLAYELHRFEGIDYVVASALLFRHRDVRLEAMPLVRFSFPQVNLRLYVVDREGVPAVLFAAILVPAWVAPTAFLVGGQPARTARFERTGEPGSESGSWEWQVHAHGGVHGAMRPRASLHCVATLGSPETVCGPQIGSWRETADYVRLRNRGYAVSRGVLKRIETEQPAVAVSPVKVDLRDASLPRVLLGTPTLPDLHSAWVCPEMRMRFDLVREQALALPRQAAVPG